MCPESGVAWPSLPGSSQRRPSLFLGSSASVRAQLALVKTAGELGSGGIGLPSKLFPVLQTEKGAGGSLAPPVTQVTNSQQRWPTRSVQPYLQLENGGRGQSSTCRLCYTASSAAQEQEEEPEPDFSLPGCALAALKVNPTVPVSSPRSLQSQRCAKDNS